MDNKELQGVMFPNTKTSEKSPDLRGSVKVGGIDYEVAGWKRTSKNGLGYLSLALQKKADKPQKQAVNHTPKQVVNKVSQAVGGVTDFSQEETEIEDALPF